MIRGLKVKEYSSGRAGITRLIVGGMHGREYEASRKILDKIKPNPSEGRVIVVPNINISGRRYVSTMNANYIKSPAGRVYLSILERYKPDVVVELHAFNSKSYKNLVSSDRIYKKGVPRLIPYRSDLPIEDRILHGGPPPFVKDRFKEKFKEHASYITLEIHEKYGKEAERTLRFIINSVINCNSVKEIREKLRERHRESMEEAGRLLRDYLSRAD
ncbi:MAG: DUF2119 domain-containing protein [Candidatus Methylarchaceae archaeon HK01B]|nr:DUF2119 domain-containing protein [Candidatus Methylarchaceae archaeon HK02M1]MCP8318335.1 DUF2119 domain-containing protein [Candidatus Methylarchaceae archaeon HK01B]